MTRLTQRGVLTRQSKGRYRFTEPLLEIYINQVGLGSSEDDGDAFDEDEDSSGEEEALAGER